MHYYRSIILSLPLIITFIFLLSHQLYTKDPLATNKYTIIIGEEQKEFKKRPLDPGGMLIPNSSSLIYEKLNTSDVLKKSKIKLSSQPEEPIDISFYLKLNNIKEPDPIDNILSKIDLNVENEITKSTSFFNLQNTCIGRDNNLKDCIEFSDSLKKNTNNKVKLNVIKFSVESNKLYELNRIYRDSGYKVQLSLAWSEREAREEWEKIRAKHIKYLKGAQSIIRKVKTDHNRIIFFVIAGNYSSLNQAKLVCRRLILNRQNCLITK